MAFNKREYDSSYDIQFKAKLKKEEKTR